MVGVRKPRSTKTGKSVTPGRCPKREVAKPSNVGQKKKAKK